MMQVRYHGCLTVLLLWGLAIPLNGAPTIKDVRPRGLQLGGPTTLVIRGQNLGKTTRVVLSCPIGEQELAGTASNTEVTLRLWLGHGVLPGIYWLRVATEDGLSNAVAIGIDDLPQQPFAGAIESLPVAMTGSISGNQVVRTTFSGQAGQPVVVDLEARRLGSPWNPVLRLLRPNGTQLAWSSGEMALAGDPRLAVTLPETGQYTVVVHDLVYRAAGNSIFRLKVGDLHYADHAFPCAVQAGKSETVRLLGTNIASPEPVLVDLGGRLASGEAVVPVSGVPHLTGAPPRLTLSPFPERIEQSTGQVQELGAPPVAVHGRIGQAGETDRYRLKVRPGQRLRFQVQAQRRGSPLDAILEVSVPGGKTLGRSDDQPDTVDPGLDVTVPGGVQELEVRVFDVRKHGGDEFLYRLVVDDLNVPECHVVLGSDRLNIPAGGTQVLRVQVQRRAYSGPVDLQFEGLPQGVEVLGGTLPEQSTVGLVTLSASGGPPRASVGHVVAIPTASAGAVPHLVTVPLNPVSQYRPHLAHELAVAVTRPAPLQLAWQLEAPYQQLLRGMTLPLGVQLKGPEPEKIRVRFRLETTQVVPKRKEKRGNQEVEVDDLDRAIHLAGNTAVEKSRQAVLPLYVPPDLPDQKFAIVLIAEVLARDGKSVELSVASPVQQFSVATPLAVSLSGPATVQARAGAGETGELCGEIQRAPGFDLPVTVTLQGLPEGFPSPSTVVPPGQTTFSLPVRFPYGTPPGELANVQLVATALPNEKRPELLVRSAPIPVKISVLAGEKPPAEPPKRVFEDEAEMVQYLSRGEGTVELDEGDKYWGKASLRVTPVQRFHESIPILGVKIRQNPGPGEYRYLRFAWRKIGGQVICLQLNHDGQWGPGGTGRAGAKFRYHAGPGPECFGASVQVSQALPSDWQVVTRDLYADFGEFTLTGLAFSPVDGRYALFDHIYLARSLDDFELLKPVDAAKKPEE